MAKTLSNYNPTVNIGGGITPAGGEFPVAESHDILVDSTGKRLDTKLDELDAQIGGTGETSVATQLSQKVAKTDITTAAPASTNTDTQVPSTKSMYTALATKPTGTLSTAKPVSGSTDTEIPTSKAVYTGLAEKVNNADITTGAPASTNTDAQVPSTKSMYTALATKPTGTLSTAEPTSSSTDTQIPTAKAVYTGLNKKVNTADIASTVAATGSTSATKVPSETAVREAIEAKTIPLESSVPAAGDSPSATAAPSVAATRTAIDAAIDDASQDFEDAAAALQTSYDTFTSEVDAKIGDPTDAADDAATAVWPRLKNAETDIDALSGQFLITDALTTAKMADNTRFYIYTGKEIHVVNATTDITDTTGNIIYKYIGATSGNYTQNNLYKYDTSTSAYVAVTAADALNITVEGSSTAGTIYRPNYWFYYDTNTWKQGSNVSSVTVDSTLSIAGAAADAKATGDAITELSNDILGASYKASEVWSTSENGILGASLWGSTGVPSEEAKSVNFNTLTEDVSNINDYLCKNTTDDYEDLNILIEDKMVTKSYNSFDYTWSAYNRLSNIGNEIKIGPDINYIKFNLLNTTDYDVSITLYNADNKNSYKALTNPNIVYTDYKNLLLRLLIKPKDDSVHMDTVSLSTVVEIKAYKNTNIQTQINNLFDRSFGLGSSFSLQQLLDFTGINIINGNTANNGTTITNAKNRMVAFNIPTSNLNLYAVSCVSDSNEYKCIIQSHIKNTHSESLSYQVINFSATYTEGIFAGDPEYINIVFLHNPEYANDVTFTAEELQHYTITFYKYSYFFQNNKYYSYEEEIKYYILKNLKHVYYSSNRLIDAFYLGTPKPLLLPFEIKLSLPEKYFYAVRFYMYYNNGVDIEDNSIHLWKSGNTIIPKNTYFALTIQNKDGSTNSILLKNIMSELVIEIAPSIVLQNDNYIPYELSNTWNTTKEFVLIHFSDIHKNAHLARRILTYYNWYNSDNNHFTDILCSGDLVADDYSEGFDWWSDNELNNVLTVIGNHDAKNTVNGNVTQVVTAQEKYNRYFAPYISNWGVEYVENKTWWRKIYTEEKIILLGIDSIFYELDSEDYIAQKTYIENTLDYALENDYSVIITEHYTIDINNATVIQCPFTGIGGMFDKLISAPYSIKNETHELVKSFQDAGGDFVCFLTGHLHSDIVAYHTAYKQLNISITSGGFNQRRQARTLNTYYNYGYDAFNLVHVDRDNHLLSLKRIGVSSDINFRNVDNITINYKTMEVL